MVDLSGWRFNFAFGAFDQANFDLEEMSTAHFCDGGRKRQHRSNARNLEQLSGGYENERNSNGFKIISGLIFLFIAVLLTLSINPLVSQSRHHEFGRDVGLCRKHYRSHCSQESVEGECQRRRCRDGTSSKVLRCSFQPSLLHHGTG